MAKIKLNLQRMAIPEKVQFVRQIVTAMTGNANFTTPEPSLTDITTAVNTLETAYNAANTARQNAMSLTSTVDDNETMLDALVAKLANYVENKTDGDDAKIQSAGMALKSKPSPVGAMPAPAALTATASDNDGEVDLSWDAVRGAKSYPAEVSPDPPTQTSWTPAGISTKSYITVKGLKSGTKYWFRVAALGAAGQGPWSDPATKYAP
jgi:hypothetical protein